MAKWQDLWMYHIYYVVNIVGFSIISLVRYEYI